jgi:hypothetical protein
VTGGELGDIDSRLWGVVDSESHAHSLRFPDTSRQSLNELISRATVVLEERDEEDVKRAEDNLRALLTKAAEHRAQSPGDAASEQIVTYVEAEDIEFVRAAFCSFWPFCT